MSRFPTTPDAPRPWWESDIGQFSAPTQRPEAGPGADAGDVQQPTVAVEQPPVVTVTPTGRAALTDRITGRGVVLLMVAPTVVLCLIGFLVSGATSIPPLAGLGLILGSVAAALVAPARWGWFPAAFPPLVMMGVILVLGQITLIGSRPTIAREFAMVVSQLTATAPAQVASVLLMAALLYLRRRRTR